MSNEVQQFFSVNQWSKMVGISRGSFYKIAKRGEGPKILKIGKRTVISWAASEEWRKRLEGREL